MMPVMAFHAYLSSKTAVQMNIKYTIAALALTLALNVSAQGKKKTVNNKAKTTKVVKTAVTASLALPANEVLYEEMLPATAKIIVFDSVVVDKDNFIDHIPLGKEAGVFTAYNRHFNTEEQPGAYLYLNELGNKMLYSKKNGQGEYQLYITDKLGDSWAEEMPVGDFEGEFSDINCPFMMSDGVTLYFSAKSDEENSLGGRDIFMTKYDVSSSKFYKPESVGLPFNSEGNDYCYIVDDYNNIGWWVTDRRQPEGKVCIYTFVPTSSRQVYEESQVGKAKLSRLAAMWSIKETWSNKSAVEAARNRLQASKQHRVEQDEPKSINFVINDNIVYDEPSDFKSPASRKLFAEYQKLSQELQTLSAQLVDRRQQYAKANAQAKRRMTAELKKMEQQEELLTLKVHRLEKDIRMSEAKNNK